MSDVVECVVIGAGVVGLAVARRLAQHGLETIVLEREAHIGTGTSSRNSEVIHAGIYYPPGSLKARFCVTGKALLYRYCSEHGVPHSRCGKLIVATAAEQGGRLQQLMANAAANGVDDLRLLDEREATALEPELNCVAAVLSPSTGIVDSHALMLALQGDFEDASGMVAFESPVVAGHCDADGIRIVAGGDAETAILARHVVNCGGLAAQQVVQALDGFPATRIPRGYFAKGNYFTLDSRAPFRHLVYPVPEPGGLGVHLTLDLGGRGRFGPDVEWVEAIDYDVDPARAGRFYGEIRKYWPALPDGALSPGYAGIRPKLGGPGSDAGDFVIQGPREHGVAGLVNLFGIESPGLTSSLAIADYVAGLLDERLAAPAR